MLKTDHVRKTGITDKVGKAIGQQPVVTRRNQQYLEVALEKSRKDSEQNNGQQLKRVDQDNRKQKKINYIPLENYGSKHVSDASTVDPKGLGNSSKATKSRGQQSEKRAKVGKVGQQSKQAGTTFQNQKQFENKENQRLYEELDQMLSGAQSLQVSAGKRKQPDKKQPEKTQPEKEPKPVKVKLKKPVGNPDPELVLEYKYKREPPSRIEKHGFFGPEGTKVWQESERRAKDVLEKLDHIDDFSFGDYSSRSKKLEAERRAKFAEYADKPIHESAHHVTGTVTSRNHIVADIPIYVPSVSDKKAPEKRPVYDSVGPNSQSDNLYNVTPGTTLPPPIDPLDTYRQHANPVNERILLERAERERFQLEKETLKFFDTGEGLNNEDEFGLTVGQLEKANADKINSSVADKQPQNSFDKTERTLKHKASDKKNSHSAGRKKTPELNHTRGSRNTYPGGSQADKYYRANSYEKYKYSPEGFQAHLDRKARLEKEARILSRVDQNKSVWDIEDEALDKQRSNQYPLDSKNNHKISAAMADSGNKGYETYRTRQGLDDKLDISTTGHQYFGQGTYRLSNGKQDRDLINSYDGRDIDQDRYSDRNVYSYRSRDVPDGSKLKSEESYSYRTSKGDLQKDQQDRNSKHTARQESEEKVEYILRSKTSDSKQSSHSIGAQEKSRSGNRNEKSMQRENTYEAAVKVKMDREVSVGSRKHKEQRQDSRSNLRSDRPTRRSPVGDETRRTLAAEVVASARTEATKSKKNPEESEFSKYFMDPERPDSKSNIIPLYSDPKSYYSMQKSDQRAENMKSPVQETGYRKQTEVPKKVAHISIGTQTLDIEPERGDKQTSTIEIKTDRTVKGDNVKTVEPASASPTGAKSALKTETLQSTSKPPTTKRESTRDKLTRQKTKEKTMDSQGPTTDGKESLEDLDMGYLNIDELDEGLEDNDIYVCYLVTDDGAAIGPMRLDIEDVQMGLPKAQEPVLTNNMETKETEKQKEEAEGMRNRQTGSHGLNEFSSRSHSMLMLTIDSEQQDPEDENLYITKRGKLTFVDLAGSEKVKDSNSTAETLVESNNINRSLLILGNCISSLGDPKRRQGHIPYRDSKLTKLLADSLGGNGVTLMICCITPSSHHASETMNTLRYASRAKKIRTKPVIKMDPREKLILSLKKEIKVLRNENHYLRQQLEFPAKPKGQLQKENDQNFVKIMKETNGKPNPPNNTLPPQEKLMQNGAKDESGLYEMLQEYMVENESLRTENSEMQVARDKQRQEQQLLYRDNEKLMKRVDELERKVSQVQSSWQAMPRQGSDPIRSRDHSPTRGSPQYAMPGSGGRQPPNRLPPPHDLPLRDPVYTGSPSQGYNSPTGSGKGKQPSRGQPLKPPHRLNEPLPQQRPVQEQNGPYMNGHPAQYRQNPGSPNRSNEMRMDSRRSSQSTSSDAIRDMNEKLKQELAQLEGQIHQHTAVNSRNRNIYGSQGSIR